MEAINLRNRESKEDFGQLLSTGLTCVDAPREKEMEEESR